MAAPQELNVIDYSDLLTESEEASLEESIATIGAQYQFDIVILTVDNLEGMTPGNYAESFYSTYGYGYSESNDGVIFLLSIAERDWYIATEGQGDVVINDYCLDIMEETVIPYMSDGDYAYGFQEFVSLTNAFVEQASIGEPYSYDNEYESFGDALFEFGIVLLAAGAIAGIYLYTLVRSMNNVRPQTKADAYMRRDTFKLRHHSDRFLYSNVTKIPKPKDNGGSHGGGGHGGGGGGGRGGKF